MVVASPELAAGPAGEGLGGGDSPGLGSIRMRMGPLPPPLPLRARTALTGPSVERTEEVETVAEASDQRDSAASLFEASLALLSPAVGDCCCCCRKVSMLVALKDASMSPPTGRLLAVDVSAAAEAGASALSRLFVEAERGAARGTRIRQPAP